MCFPERGKTYDAAFLFVLDAVRFSFVRFSVIKTSKIIFYIYFRKLIKML